MRDDVQDLIYLQDFDHQIDRLRDDLERLPRQRDNANAQLDNDTKKVADAKAAHQANEIEIKGVELDIGTRRTTISKLKTQQFETKKNEEYTRLGGEVTRYEGQVDELETRELELMEKGDTIKEQIAAAEADLARTQDFVDDDLAKIEVEENAAREKLATLEEQRATAAAKIPEELLSSYERLYKKHKGKAVNAVTAEKNCTGCHVKVTPTTFVQAKSEDTVAECDNCGAILYYKSEINGSDETY